MHLSRSCGNFFSICLIKKWTSPVTDPLGFFSLDLFYKKCISCSSVQGKTTHGLHRTLSSVQGKTAMFFLQKKTAMFFLQKKTAMVVKDKRGRSIQILYFRSWSCYLYQTHLFNSKLGVQVHSGTANWLSASPEWVWRSRNPAKYALTPFGWAHVSPAKQTFTCC
jgi:hypothetical protein